MAESNNDQHSEDEFTDESSDEIELATRRRVVDEDDEDLDGPEEEENVSEEDEEDDLSEELELATRRQVADDTNDPLDLQNEKESTNNTQQDKIEKQETKPQKELWSATGGEDFSWAQENPGEDDSSTGSSRTRGRGGRGRGGRGRNSRGRGKGEGGSKRKRKPAKVNAPNSPNTPNEEGSPQPQESAKANNMIWTPKGQVKPEDAGVAEKQVKKPKRKKYRKKKPVDPQDGEQSSGNEPGTQEGNPKDRTNKRKKRGGKPGRGGKSTRGDKASSDSDRSSRSDRGYSGRSRGSRGRGRGSSRGDSRGGRGQSGKTRGQSVVRYSKLTDQSNIGTPYYTEYDFAQTYSNDAGFMPYYSGYPAYSGYEEAMNYYEPPAPATNGYYSGGLFYPYPVTDQVETTNTNSSRERKQIRTSVSNEAPK